MKGESVVRGGIPLVIRRIYQCINYVEGRKVRFNYEEEE